MNKRIFLFLILGGIFFTSCDLSVPGKPDFTTSHSVEVPILNNKTYVFLGGDSGALIDTTKENLDSLFVLDQDGVISITTEEEFDFGDLDDAVPEIDGSSTSFNSAVGEIEIGNFSSGNGDLGTTNFDEINSSGGGAPPAGTPVPAGDNSAVPVTINIGNNTDFFTSATIKDGSLDITVTNELGFDIANLELTLLSNGTQVGTKATFANLTNGATETAGFTFSDGDELASISVDVVMEWDAFVYPATTGDLIINSAEGNNLFASAVTANLEPQDFSTTSTSSFSDTEFKFTDAAHYVELSGGEISVTNLVNNMGIGIETLQISFPGIRSSENLADSLVINFPALPANLPANDITQDLTGYRIYALNNEVSYNIVAATENTQTGPNAGAVTITESDEITANVDISGLKVGTAFGIVLQQNVLLGDNDVSNDGVGVENLDVFNDIEAELTTIDGLDEFSDQIDGFKFTAPIININYNTNIKISTTIYGALVGIDGKGNEVYLSGKDVNGVPGPNKVKAGDPITGLLANGRQLTPDELVKFSIDNSTDCISQTCQISFNINTTNVDDFLNNLPNDIRFIGRAVVNEDEGEATITTPLEFTPGLAVDLPLAFSTEVGSPASFTDTLDLDIGLGDGTKFTEGKFYMIYSNNLPLGLNVEMSFQDSLYNEAFAIPNQGEEIRLVASPVDDVTGFATGGQERSFSFSLTEAQLRQLDDLSFVEINVNLRSSENKAVKLRASDSFTLTIGAKIKIQTEVK